MWVLHQHNNLISHHYIFPKKCLITPVCLQYTSLIRISNCILFTTHDFLVLIHRLEFYFLSLRLRFLKHLYLAHKRVSVLLPLSVLLFLNWLSNLHLILYKPFIIPPVHYRTQKDPIMYFYKLNVKQWEPGWFGEYRE